MKKILLIVAFLIISGSLFAQSDVTTFLGIPVDGYKAEMIEKLKAKGFTSSSYDKDVLEGEFNGTKVNVHVVTNNNKVYRIMVSDANTISETDIKIKFNNLCRQFANNKKYIPLSDEDYALPESEDISYEMTVHKKRYEAGYFQRSGPEDFNYFNRVVWFMINEFRGKYYISMFYDNECNRANGEDL